MDRPTMSWEQMTNRLASFDKRLPPGTAIAPPDMFLPSGPRLGVSGSLGVPPTLPARKKKPVVESDEESDDDEDGGDDDEKELGEKGNSEFGSSGDSSPSSDDEAIYSQLWIKDLAKAGQAPLPAPKKKKPPAEPLTHEGIMRRMIKKPDEVLRPELIEWDGPITDAQLHDHQMTMTRLHAAQATGTPGVQSTLRQLNTHTLPLGSTSDSFDKYAKAYCATKDFADLDVFEDILQGKYKLKV
jgi:hypothetical protein